MRILLSLVLAALPTLSHASTCEGYGRVQQLDVYLWNIDFRVAADGLVTLQADAANEAFHHRFKVTSAETEIVVKTSVNGEKTVTWKSGYAVFTCP